MRAIGRIEGDRWTRILGERSQQTPHLSRLARQVAEEREAGSPIPRHGERRGDCAGTRDRDHRVPRFPCRLDQRLAGVGERRRAGIADERDVALFEGGHHARQAAALDWCPVADQRLADGVAREQPRRDPRVLRGNRAHLAQDAHCTRRNVLEVADRGGNHEQAAQSASSQAPTRSEISADGPTNRDAGGSTSRNAFP